MRAAGGAALDQVRVTSSKCHCQIGPFGGALSAALTALALRSQRTCSRRAERPRHLDRLPEKGRERHWRGRVHGTYGALFLRFWWPLRGFLARRGQATGARTLFTPLAPPLFLCPAVGGNK